MTAAAKGLVTGALTFCRRDGSILDVADDKEGALVPALRDILSVDMAGVRWILVIEKEATFRSIAASSFWKSNSARGVIITGKGYPDLATRAMVHFLSHPSLKNGFASPSVYGLADFDPDGIAILSTYKYGSKRLAHEGAEVCTPRLQWLGLRGDHLAQHSDEIHATQGLLPLTVRDRAKAAKMLQQPCWIAGDEQIEIERELQRMLMLNVKAELQFLDATLGSMSLLLSAALGDL